jgi:hypothetical protein
MAFAARAGWHLRLALRLSRWAMGFAFLLGLFVRVALPVRDGWIAGAVAAVAALLFLGILALGSRGPDRPLPPPTHEAALEQARGADHVAHALARSTLMLGSFAIGLALGAAAGLDRA